MAGILTRIVNNSTTVEELYLNFNKTELGIVKLSDLEALVVALRNAGYNDLNCTIDVWQRTNGYAVGVRRITTIK